MIVNLTVYRFFREINHKTSKSDIFFTFLSFYFHTFILQKRLDKAAHAPESNSKMDIYPDTNTWTII